MKFIRSLSAGVCGFGLLVGAIAQNNPVKFELPQVGSNAATPAASAPAATPTAPAAAAPAVKFTESQLLEAYGYSIAANLNLRDQDFTTAQVDAIAKGMAAAVAGKELGYDAQQLVPQLQEFLGAKQQILLGKVRNANLSAAASFFTKLKENKNVIELPSGLRYEIVTEGKGAIAKDGQVAKIHLIGAFINGQLFENTRLAPEGQTAEPVEVLVKDGSNIPGIIEALKLMPTGSKWRLYVPPHLAFGDDGARGIPPAATLLFEIEVFGVTDAPKEEPKK
jgi:FKBP-type peptidyl-prolyl cis-trans isomerase